MVSNTESEEVLQVENIDEPILSDPGEGAVGGDLNFEQCPIGSFKFDPYSSDSLNSHLCQPCWDLSDVSLMNPMCQTFWLLIFLMFSVTLLFLQIFVKIKFKLRRLEDNIIYSKSHDHHLQEAYEEEEEDGGMNENEEEFYEILKSISLRRSFPKFKAHSCHFIGYWMNCLKRWGYEELVVVV